VPPRHLLGLPFDIGHGQATRILAGELRPVDAEDRELKPVARPRRTALPPWRSPMQPLPAALLS
jgi:hypothetical protein